MAYTTEMGLEIDQQSALNLLTFIGTDDADAFNVFGESDERFHVRGGNDLIPRALAAAHGRTRSKPATCSKPCARTATACA